MFFAAANHLAVLVLLGTSFWRQADAFLQPTGTPASVGVSHATFSPISRPFTIPTQRSQRDVSLAMGFGLGKRFGGGKRRGGDSDDLGPDDDDDTVSSYSTISVSQAMSQAASSSTRTSYQTPSPVRMGEDASTRSVDVRALDKNESVQERINRVKAGKMTQEEKEAFLESALTAGSTVDARKPVIRHKEPEKTTSASPFPTDEAFRSLASGGKLPVTATEKVVSSQQKKKEYLDMITSPNRFSPYKTYTQNFRQEDNIKQDFAQFDDINSNEYYPEEETSPPAFEPQRPVSLQNSANRRGGTFEPQQQRMPNDLGARLGMAAMASESQRQKELLKAEAARREQERIREKERQEFERQALEIARQKQEEMNQREMQARERRRQEEADLAAQKAREKRETEDRMNALMAAQEEYWKKKLANERAKKAQMWGAPAIDEDDDKEDQSDGSETDTVAKVETTMDEPGVPEKEIVEKTPETTVAEAPEAVPVPSPSPSLESGIFNPDENYLIQQGENDREFNWEHNQETIAREASRYSGTNQFGDIQTESEFIVDQAIKKNELDQQRDEQLERLKALNSPLPSPVKEPRAMPPTPPQADFMRYPVGFGPQGRFDPQNRSRLLSKIPPAPFEPQKPAGTPGRFEPQRTVTSPPKKSDQLNSLFNSLNSDNEEETVDTDAEKSTAVAELDNDEKKDTKPGWGNLFGGATKPAESTAAQPKKVAAPSKPEPKKGPIRMEIPLGDEVEEGGSMDIKEAIKQAKRKASGSSSDQSSRSKKWGIDMSRFEE